MRHFLFFIFCPLWLSCCEISFSLFFLGGGGILFEDLTKINMHIVVIDTFPTLCETMDKCTKQLFASISDSASAQVSFQHEFARFSFSLLNGIVLRSCIG